MAQESCCRNFFCFWSGARSSMSLRTARASCPVPTLLAQGAGEGIGWAIAGTTGLAVGACLGLLLVGPTVWACLAFTPSAERGWCFSSRPQPGEPSEHSYQNHYQSDPTEANMNPLPVIRAGEEDDATSEGSVVSEADSETSVASLINPGVS